MKKLFIGVLVAMIGLAFTAPAFAVDHEFGGYWRVRMFTQKNFDGSDNEGLGSDDLARADTRTRLYYTATLNDNLKFVNKFEMDAVWGDGGSYGDIGSDGVNFEVKHSYAAVDFGGVKANIGTQGTVISRGFIFDDDFSGIVIAADALAARYIKITEASTRGNVGHDAAAYNVDYTIDLGDVKIKPGITYGDLADGDDVWYLAIDVDATLGGASLWGTAVYNGGEIGDDDVSAFLLAAGGSASLTDMVSLHGQAFYATGDDDATDDDLDNFQSMPGQSWYWSEIMGLGTFDSMASNNSPANAISNIFAANLGVKAKPSDKLTLTADLWYAILDEDTAAGDDDLGLEVDLKATYQLVEGLNLDIIGAYLFAGDATETDPDDENPWEVGTRLSLSF